MNDLLKKGFLLGLGAAVMSKEKVENYFQELVAKGKLTPKEADDLYESLLRKGEETGDKWNRRSKERIHNILTDLDMVTKEEWLELKSRLDMLEERLDAFMEEDKK
ncbi:phasin family protein [Evansella tamaricis]|uniref:Polyhydroxyalkanoate synthesis regulator phasin n=1 Tax=Evansella tamaricis TaxID=2069301 RepID=A0ABS6JBT8_9BACI|nr:hypothetical protein [Evansella tamaricis]MBU9711149.1 hypothetical protein [Evansella tamaricis]